MSRKTVGYIIIENSGGAHAPLSLASMDKKLGKDILVRGGTAYLFGTKKSAIQAQDRTKKYIVANGYSWNLGEIWPVKAESK